MSITTHVLNTATGLPAEGIEATLSRLIDGEFSIIAEGITNADGRIADLLTDKTLGMGTYRLHFSLEDYFARHGVNSFYPYADVVFKVAEAPAHYHIPLLLSPFGYSTYRGS
uniref:5-hydroxyisourate hydrolase n=1 Tax=Candidatus Kentrum sp. FW TaxID=2126338 RepID=A0A450TSV2_9GAMM|nr:MAG: 5-hydroxyisourate hydrolase [Candidatus Kentron sp. FW]